MATAKKNKGGRPQKYTDEELIELCEAYIEEWEASDKKLPPSVSKCAIRVGMSRERLWQRSNSCEELFNTIKKVITLERSELIDGGLTGKYQQTMAIFVLKNLGMTDRPAEDTEAESDDDSTGIIEIPQANTITPPED